MNCVVGWYVVGVKICLFWWVFVGCYLFWIDLGVGGDVVVFYYDEKGGCKLVRLEIGLWYCFYRVGFFRV